MWCCGEEPRLLLVASWPGFGDVQDDAAISKGRRFVECARGCTRRREPDLCAV